MSRLINRSLYGSRANVTKDDAAKIASPRHEFPSPQFKENIKYLAYGSNLSAETFLGRRGIKPFSQVNVRVPSLTLTFDLAGVPYNEPRFANVRPREEGDQELIGVVYEVTPEDYSTILKTEGGYNVINVPCIPLTPVEGIESFNSKTLIVPTPGTRQSHDGLPSLRYLNLLLHGAKEHELPQDYQLYLTNTGYYKAKTLRQRIGAAAVGAIVVPIIAFIFGLRALLSNKNGKTPHFVGVLQRYIFLNIWVVYDLIWKPLYGDGESEKEVPKPEKGTQEETEQSPESQALLVQVEEMTANSPKERSNA